MKALTSNEGSIIQTLDDGSLSTIPRGQQRVSTAGNFVIVRDDLSGTRWNLDPLDTTVDGGSFSTADTLASKISSFSRGGGDGDGVTWTDTSMLPVAGKIPIWSEQGLLSTGEPLFPENAVNLAYLQTLTGWAIYNDSILTSASPLISTIGNRVKITNNANSIINDQLPVGITSFWNNTTNKVIPDSIGDSYNINLRFIAVSTSNQGLADVEFDVGGALGVISSTTLSMRKGIGAEQKFNLNFDVYSGSTFLSNGGEFYIKSIDGDTSIHDIRLKITRVHKGR